MKQASNSGWQSKLNKYLGQSSLPELTYVLLRLGIIVMLVPFHFIGKYILIAWSPVQPIFFALTLSGAKSPGSRCGKKNLGKL